VKICIPVKTVSELNQRCHWTIRSRRIKEHRALAACVTRSALRTHGPPKPPILITLVRIGPRTLDTDNLAGSLKGVRDGIADALRMNDGDTRITWQYRQRCGNRGEYSVEAEFE